MHVVALLKCEMFDLEVGGRKGSISDIFPAWNAHDRFGLVIDSPLGGLGATYLIQIAITSFYDIKPSRRVERKIYPEIYALHSGKGYGAHAAFDFWPQRREKILPDGPRTVLDAINDCGITRLAVPERLPQEVEHRPKEEDAALDRIVTAVAYSPSGRVARPDFTVSGNDKRTEYNPGRVLRPRVVRQPAPQHTGVPVKEVDPSYQTGYWKGMPTSAQRSAEPPNGGATPSETDRVSLPKVIASFL
ncbi:hypothetical protein NKI38_30785 [Mesorhizobium sp. M0621]|uniref:hypothetical protein n=1 Tax=Mesorhizobium sp. M0621 TaxID=2956974 RepID=UPI003336066D